MTPFELDRTRFPMIWSEALHGYVNLVPITKIQLEYFLADTYDPQHGADFYDALLALNDRVSPGQIRRENYIQALATGLWIADVKTLAEWFAGHLDQSYEILEETEWFALYDEFKTKPPWSPEQLASLRSPNGVSILPRAVTTLRNLAAAVAREKPVGQPFDLADACLLRGGACEWVRRGTDYRVAGQPNDRHRQGIIHLDGKGREARAAGNASTRNPIFGARFLRRTT